MKAIGRLVLVLLMLLFALPLIQVGIRPVFAATSQRIYYLRDDLPTQGQDIGIGTDVGSLLETQPTVNETRTCTYWVQFWFDEEEPIEFWNITQIYWHVYWKVSHSASTAYLGYQCNGTYSSTNQQEVSLGYALSYQLYTSTWNVSIQPPNIANRYNFTVKLRATLVGYPSILSGPYHMSFIRFTYQRVYRLNGLYDETTGLFMSLSERAVNVTAYFTGGQPSETFTVNGTYMLSVTDLLLYFYFDVGPSGREYWIGSTEQVFDLFIFTAPNLTSYTVKFLDLAGALSTYPYIEPKRYINGTLITVEKRKVDAEKKVVFSLQQGSKYNIEIKDGATYTFGDLLFSSETTITLTLKGIEFPSDIALAYQYVRIYAYRHQNQSSITVIYQDTQQRLANVKVDIQYENGTSVSGSYPYWHNYTYLFNHTWASAVYNTTYRVKVMIYHTVYGQMPYNQLLARAWSVQPWGIPFGSIPGINTSDIIPMIIIFACFVIFSQINAPTGAFIGVMVAVILTWLGWITIPASLLIAAISFTIMFGLAHARRRG